MGSLALGGAVDLMGQDAQRSLERNGIKHDIPLKTNEYPLKIDGWKMKCSLKDASFSGSNFRGVCHGVFSYINFSFRSFYMKIFQPALGFEGFHRL